MKRILKYEIQASVAEVTVVDGAEFLSVGGHNERLYAWFLCPDSALTEVRIFKVVGTGWQLTDADLDGLVYVGTVQMPIEDSEQGKQLVWHVWIDP